MKDKIVLGFLFLTTVFGAIASFLPAGNLFEEMAREVGAPIRKGLTVYFYSHSTLSMLGVLALIILALLFLGLLTSGRRMHDFTLAFVGLILLYTFANLSFQISLNGIGAYLPGQFDRLWPFHAMGNVNAILLGFFGYLFITRKKNVQTNEGILDDNFEEL